MICCGEAEGVVCWRGLSDLALPFLRAPAPEWQAAHPDMIGISANMNLAAVVPEEIKARRFCHYVLTDGPLASMGVDDLRHRAAFELIGDGIWLIKLLAA